MRVLLALVLQWYGGTGAAAMQQMREAWRPPMVCESACAWAAAASKAVCIPKKAVFRFHGWRDPGTDEQIKIVNDMWIEVLPENMREFARKNWLRSLKEPMFEMTGAELIAFGKKECR
jgi:hypothetical protein